MSHPNRVGFARCISRLAIASALCVAPAWAGAAGLVVAAVTPSQTSADRPVKDLGRIDAVAGYDAGVWRALALRARHPDQRSECPRRWSGKVDVAFAIAPDGSVREAAIAQSSLSYALDGNAIRTVQRARFEPLPAQAHAEGSPRQYVVTFDYRD